MDYKLSEEQIMIKKMVNDFAQNKVKPQSVELESRVDPKDCFPAELVKEAARLGIMTMPLPTEHGGMGLTDLFTQLLVMEELGAADLGFASIIRVQASMIDLLMKLFTDRQKECFIPNLVKDDLYLLAQCITEPDAGSDANIPYDAPGASIQTYAEKKGDKYIINGRKQFISNGSVAKLLFVYARTNKELPVSKALSCFLVPAGTPGFSIGKVHDKLGRRLLMNAELNFDNVEIPDWHLVGKENCALEDRKGRGSILHTACQLGTLSTCYEEALKYARIRVQGGKPIIQHVNIAHKLGDMQVKIEAARRLLYWYAWSWDNDYQFNPKLQWLIKAYLDDISVVIANNMVDIFGGSGTDKDLPIEKYLRDIYTVLHGFGMADLNYVKGVC